MGARLGGRGWWSERCRRVEDARRVHRCLGTMSVHGPAQGEMHPDLLSVDSVSVEPWSTDNLGCKWSVKSPRPLRKPDISLGVRVYAPYRLARTGLVRHERERHAEIMSHME